MMLKEKPNDTCNAILDAAIELFVTKGFESTQMDAIAIAAKVAKGTLYYHYASKEGIVDAIVERDAAAVGARLAEIESRDGLGFVEKLAASVATMTELLRASYSMVHRMRHIDIRDRTLWAMVKHCAPHFARILEEGKRAGLCSVAFPAEYAEIFLASSQFLLAPEFGAEKVSRRIKAFSQLSATAFGMDAKAFAPVYKPIADLAASLTKKLLEPHDD